MADAKPLDDEYRSDHPGFSFGEPRDLNMVITELKHGGLVGCGCCDIQVKYKKSEEYAGIVEEVIAADRKRIEELEGKPRCEHCGSDRIYSGPPDCPSCGAPNCCQTCCKEALLENERDNQAATIERLRGEKKERDDLLTEVMKMDLDIRIEKTMKDFYERQRQALARKE